MTLNRRCLDCEKEGVTTRRKALKVGNQPYLCASHRRKRKFDRRSYSWEKHIQATYGLSTDEYWRIYKIQGERCAICQRATGARKKLSVDHDHATGYIRGLLCTPCNRNVLGHLRDEIAALNRAVHYLKYPPAGTVIGNRAVPDN